MLFKVRVAGSDGRALEYYYVEAEALHEAPTKAQAAAEKEYPDEKPITVTHVEEVSNRDVIR